MSDERRCWNNFFYFFFFRDRCDTTNNARFMFYHENIYKIYEKNAHIWQWTTMNERGGQAIHANSHEICARKIFSLICALFQVPSTSKMWIVFTADDTECGMRDIDRALLCASAIHGTVHAPHAHKVNGPSNKIKICQRQPRKMIIIIIRIDCNNNNLQRSVGHLMDWPRQTLLAYGGGVTMRKIKWIRILTSKMC